ncbi:hypothetical protein [Methylobacterium sp. E-045]|uniref:hypothetical protein n=1 Tax=Methylobacterium sp. E-045 TaxID=2836575 RepID=UPI001FB9FA26|nr:hypothetical protein [Methylobacterium sp. E-045]MCJ2127343.1 hypothetical protein [Methylobacterium sp. E-045]
MAETGVYIGSELIIFSGVAIVEKDEEVKIDPFGEEGFPLYFRVIFDETITTPTTYLVAEEKFSVVELTMPWRGHTSTGNAGGLAFADNDLYIFNFRYMVHFIGKLEKYTYQLAYNITREAR